LGQAGRWFVPQSTTVLRTRLLPERTGPLPWRFFCITFRHAAIHPIPCWPMP